MIRKLTGNDASLLTTWLSLALTSFQAFSFDKFSSQVTADLSGEIFDEPVAIALEGDWIQTSNLCIPDALAKYRSIQLPVPDGIDRNDQQQLKSESTVRVEITSDAVARRASLYKQIESTEFLPEANHEFVLALSMGQGVERGVLKMDAFLRHWLEGNPYRKADVSWSKLSFEEIRNFKYTGSFGAENFGDLTSRTLGQYYPMQFVFDDLVLSSVFKDGYEMERVSLRPLTAETARMRKVEAKIQKKATQFYHTPTPNQEPLVGCSPLRHYENVYQSVRTRGTTVVFTQKFCGHSAKVERPWVSLTYRMNFDPSFNNLTSAVLTRSGNIDLRNDQKNSPASKEIHSTEYQVSGPFKREDRLDSSVNFGRGLLKEVKDLKKAFE